MMPLEKLVAAVKGMPASSVALEDDDWEKSQSMFVADGEQHAGHSTHPSCAQQDADFQEPLGLEAFVPGTLPQGSVEALFSAERSDTLRQEARRDSERLRAMLEQSTATSRQREEEVRRLREEVADLKGALQAGNEKVDALSNRLGRMETVLEQQQVDLASLKAAAEERERKKREAREAKRRVFALDDEVVDQRIREATRRVGLRTSLEAAPSRGAASNELHEEQETEIGLLKPVLAESREVQNVRQEREGADVGGRAPITAATTEADVVETQSIQPSEEVLAAPSPLHTRFTPRPAESYTLPSLPTSAATASHQHEESAVHRGVKHGGYMNHDPVMPSTAQGPVSSLAEDTDEYLKPSAASGVIDDADMNHDPVMPSTAQGPVSSLDEDTDGYLKPSAASGVIDDADMNHEPVMPSTAQGPISSLDEDTDEYLKPPAASGVIDESAAGGSNATHASPLDDPAARGSKAAHAPPLAPAVVQAFKEWLEYDEQVLELMTPDEVVAGLERALVAAGVDLSGAQTFTAARALLTANGHEMREVVSASVKSSRSPTMKEAWTQFNEFLKRKKRRLSQEEAPQELPPRRRKSSRVERANALLATGGWERSDATYGLSKPLRADFRTWIMATTGMDTSFADECAGRACRSLAWALKDEYDLPDLHNMFTCWGALEQFLQDRAEKIKTFHTTPLGVEAHEMLLEFVKKRVWKEEPSLLRNGKQRRSGSYSSSSSSGMVKEDSLGQDFLSFIKANKERVPNPSDLAYLLQEQGCIAPSGHALTWSEIIPVVRRNQLLLDEEVMRLTSSAQARAAYALVKRFLARKAKSDTDVDGALGLASTDGAETAASKPKSSQPGVVGRLMGADNNSHAAISVKVKEELMDLEDDSRGAAAAHAGAKRNGAAALGSDGLYEGVVNEQDDEIREDEDEEDDDDDDEDAMTMW